MLRAFSPSLWGVALLSSLAATHGSAAPSTKAISLPQCREVHLKASYLAQVAPSAGEGFLVEVFNDSSQKVVLASPIPSSAHWYAQQAGGNWLWRASSGAGGALVDATREHGPLVAYLEPVGATAPTNYVQVAPHEHQQLTVSVADSPILRFRPGCAKCSNPQDERFRAVLAYAYIAPRGQKVEGLLPCALRSEPVPMPPQMTSQLASLTSVLITEGEAQCATHY